MMIHERAAPKQRPTTTRRLATWLATTLGAAALALAGASANADPERDDGPLVGSWKILIEPPVSFLPAHLTFASFAAEGIVVAAPIVYLPSPFFRMDTAHGAWNEPAGTNSLRRSSPSDTTSAGKSSASSRSTRAIG